EHLDPRRGQRPVRLHAFDDRLTEVDESAHPRSLRADSAPANQEASAPALTVAAGRSAGTHTMPSLNPAEPTPKAALNRSTLTSVISAVISTSCLAVKCS